MCFIIKDNNKAFTNFLRQEIKRRFRDSPGETLGYYELEYHKEMEEIRRNFSCDLIKNIICENYKNKIY